jgi:hypothetical protein
MDLPGHGVRPGRRPSHGQASFFAASARSFRPREPSLHAHIHRNQTLLHTFLRGFDPPPEQKKNNPRQHGGQPKQAYRNTSYHRFASLLSVCPETGQNVILSEAKNLV